MNLRPQNLLLSTALALAISSCATVPPGPPPEIVRLQTQLDRLHADPRIVDNAGPELNNADLAVDTLARNARTLDSVQLQQGVYIADRLVQIAEATALARFEERRGTQLGIERERLLADTDRATRVIVASEPVVSERVVSAPATTVGFPANESISSGERISISIAAPVGVDMSIVEDGATTMNFTS